MEEQLISFETAKLAKKKGFDISTEIFYSKDGELIEVEPCFCHPEDDSCSCGFWDVLKEGKSSPKAPTQSLLQKWLREKYHIRINIKALGQCLYNLEVDKLAGETLILGNRDTYEEALEIGLQEALKLIEKKG